MDNVNSAETTSKLKHKLPSDSDECLLGLGDPKSLTASTLVTTSSSDSSSLMYQLTDSVGPMKKARTSQTVPSSPIWQMSPSHEISCDWIPPFGTAVSGLSSPGRTLGHQVAARLKRERDSLLEEWVAQMKRRQDAQMNKSGSSNSNPESKSLEEMEKIRLRVKEELSVEYDKRLSEVETRLKSELETLEAREESLTNELQAKDASLEGEKKKLKETMDILESELQCSICSEMFINAMTLGCAHSFCEFCINSWKSKPYSHNQCPICRSPINIEVRSLVLDQYIERIVDKLDPELAEVRSKIVEQRKESEEMQVMKDKMERDNNASNHSSSLLDMSNDSLGGNASSNSTSNSAFSTGSTVHSRINISGGSQSGPIFSSSSRSSGHRYGRDNLAGSSRNSGGGTSHRGSNRYGSHGNSAHHVGGNGSGLSGSSNRGYMGGSGHRSSIGGGGSSTGNHNGQSGYHRGPFRSTINRHGGRSGNGNASSSSGGASNSGQNSGNSASQSGGGSSTFHDRIGAPGSSSTGLSGSGSGNGGLGSSGGDYSSGIPGRYFGGYGHCYKCGRRGHWANGCPF